MNHPFLTECITAYTQLIVQALPVVFFIGGCNIAINMICSAFFRGDLKIGGK